MILGDHIIYYVHLLINVVKYSCLKIYLIQLNLYNILEEIFLIMESFYKFIKMFIPKKYLF
jgi:hypothetical protein